MCSGISLERRDIPDELVERYQLSDRIASRGDGGQEIQFLYRAKKAILPAWVGGRLEIFEWGNRDDRDSKLPHTGWCRLESLEAGKWGWLRPEPIEIPAAMGLEKGVWFQAPGAMLKGVLVYDEQRRPHVYMLTQAASHYYEVMTKHDREPVFVHGTI